MDSFRLIAGGFEADDFARYIDARFGSGDPVYWYAIGDATTFPDGTMFMRTEGYDTGRLLEFDRKRCEATGLTRKLIVLRNPASGEIITGPDGKPAWISNFTYQLFKMRLEDGFLVYEAQQGAGEMLNTATGGSGRSEIQRFDDMTVYTTPVNYEMPMDEQGEIWKPVWETYDFIARTDKGSIRYDGLWSGSFPMPPGMGPGLEDARSSMHAYFHRYDRYADLPASIRSFVEQHAPMWKGPPANLDEIRELQQ